MSTEAFMDRQGRSALDPAPAQVGKRLRQRQGLQLLLHVLALALLATVLMGCFTRSAAALATAALLGALAGWGPGGGNRWVAGLSPATLAAHLDRCLPGLEESAGLALAPQADPTTVDRLQRQRVLERWSAQLSDSTAWLPALRWRGPALIAAVALALLPLALAGPERNGPTAIGGVADRAGIASAELALRLITLEISPPDYTGLPARSQQDFDLEVPEGSRLRWVLELADHAGLPAGSPAMPTLVINDGETLRLSATRDAPGRYHFEHTVQRTGLYRITVGDNDERSTDIHTLAVQQDRVPVLTVVEPATNRLDIPLEGPARFRSRILVRDDFGVASVELRASVASGSGEGVKFRDESFPLNGGKATDDGVLYTRDWSLEALGMAPGDELYFFAVAQDRRAPEPNEGRSDTIVVRWQDEAVAVTQAAGLAVDVLPEYFKSQRQIIIETEALIADRDALGPARLETLSRELAQAQADLKERYGQYLGDEYEDGDAAAFAPADAEAGDDEDEEDGDHAGHDHAGHGHDGHDHGEAPTVDTSGDAQALIGRFMHDHGAADIGRITRRNPVGLMKRSLSNMWEAELHLHLAEPEKALPFEVEALKYLNLARQADRIYTQRLGFEPPPVTEDRRLTGKLDEVNSRQRQQAGSDAVDLEQLARTLYATLGTLAPDEPLGENARGQLRLAAERLTVLAQERPAMIRQVAVIERMLQADRINPEACGACAEQLRETAWSLAGTLQTAPTRRSFEEGAGDQEPTRGAKPESAAARYREALEQLLTPDPATRKPAAGSPAGPGVGP